MILAAFLAGVLVTAYGAVGVLALIIIAEPGDGTRPAPWRAVALAAAWPLTLFGLFVVILWALARDVIAYGWNHTIRRR